MAPKREGVDLFGMPLGASSSRSRPGTSNAIHQASPYTFGTAAFASSSSSSLGQLNIRSQAISEPNLAALSGPVSATEAPHLSTAEAFFGRMTLTAPDNMRRKKLEEREKKKQIRKKRAERGAMAAATLASPPEIGPSHMNQALNDAAIATAAGSATITATPPTEPSSRRRKRPALPTSNSGSNLQIHTLEQSRSRSPTRHARPQSAQGSTATSRQTSPERRQNRQRNRAGSDGNVAEDRLRASSALASAPSHQPASESEGIAEQQTLQSTSEGISSLPTAAQRRRDIYADLESLGLPGADEADLEDQPPPFPAYARRPISPPRMPAEGEEWTEDMRRRQEEYEMNRPPDSPPPAFRSDDETRQQRGESGGLSSSDDESLSGEVIIERQDWDNDIAAGFTLEERIERDRMRREAREGPVEPQAIPLSHIEDQFLQPTSVAQPITSSHQEAVEEAVDYNNELALQNARQVDPTVDLPDEDVVLKSEDVEAQAEGRVSEEQPIVQVVSQPELVTESSVKTSNKPQEAIIVTQAPLNLGRLVMEARARRASAAQQGSNERKSESEHSRQPSKDSLKDTQVPTSSILLATSSSKAETSIVQSDPKEPLESATTRLLQSFASPTLQRVESQPLHNTATTSTNILPGNTPAAASSSSPATLVSRASHRRVASEGTADLEVTPQKVRSAVAAPTKKRIISGRALKEGKIASKEDKAPLKSINKRFRPSGETHSRFRDGASAAANRRMLLWGPSSAALGVASLPDPIPGSIDVTQTTNDADTVASSQDINLATLRLLRQGSSSSNPAITSAHEGDGEASSDSDAKWDKEEAAFQAIQRRLAPALIDDDSSEEEEATSARKHDQRPNWFRSNSMDLAKPGSSVPRAPPPLVLGRSRGGGAEYSSSSESSSESGAGRMDAESDDSLSPVEVEEAPSEGRPSFNLPDRASEKGKQPIRPRFTEADRSISTPMPSMSSTPAMPRAGEFEEDSGSSHDFASDEEETKVEQLKSPSSDSLARPAVGNRLKTLFSTPLNSAQQSAALQPSAASRSTLESLFETRIDSSRPSIASRKSSLSIKDIDTNLSLSRQSSESCLRSRERANAYAALESKERDATNEEQNRLEALESISRLQQVGYSGLRTTGAQQDSLEVLERLLSRPSFMSNSSNEQSIIEGRAGLRRSGAINRQGVAGPFVNPRSSVAPRPLGRLPTITSATRHFPPTLQTAADTASNVSSPSISSQTSQLRRSNIGTPSWMANIPDDEKRALPEPLEPTKKNQNGPVYSNNPRGPPPPLPFRSAGSRVSAMVERFEDQTTQSTSPILSPRSLSREAFFTATSPTLPLEELRREDSLRRRPPPPPPPSSWQRQRPVSVSVPRSPMITSSSDSFLTASSSQGDGLASGLPALPFRRPIQEQPASGSTLQSVGQSSSLQSPLLKDLAGLGISPTQDSTAAPPLSRSKPLPIPPILKPVAPSSSSNSVQQLLPTEEELHQESSEEEEIMSKSPTQVNSNDTSTPSAATAAASSSTMQEDASRCVTTREASLGYTDLDLFASRLADQGTNDGTNYEDLNLLAEFLGPAKPSGATAEEIEALSVGVIEVLRKRVVGKKENGKDKIKLVLNLMGVKVERCGVCLVQFKEGNLACLFPCLHVLHESCATKLLRNTKLCPMCRKPAIIDR